jgi:hypothetical protein
LAFSGAASWISVTGDIDPSLANMFPRQKPLVKLGTGPLDVARVVEMAQAIGGEALPAGLTL